MLSFCPNWGGFQIGNGMLVELNKCSEGVHESRSVPWQLIWSCESWVDFIISTTVLRRVRKPMFFREERKWVKKGLSPEFGKCSKGVGKSVAVPWQLIWLCEE